MLILILILIALLSYCFWKNYKRIKLSNVFLVSGGVKCGKSFLCVRLAIKQYRIAVFRWRIQTFIRKLFKKDIELKPMLYSNIKLKKVNYQLLTLDIIERKVRIPNKSIVLIDEASLLADSMLYKNDIINERIMLFIKLFGHYTHGGYCIINTQAIGDLHYNLKRCVSSYLYIYSKIRLPFITILKVREMLHMEDVENNVNTDIEDDLKTLIVFNKYYKMYDCYCYSIFTDFLPFQVDYNEAHNNKLEKDLKTKEIISFRKFQTLGGLNNEKK